MKYNFLFLFVLFSASLFAQPYKKLHEESVVTDSHNDILSTCLEKGYHFDDNLKGKTHSDVSRMKNNVDVQVFSIWCDGFL